MKTLYVIVVALGLQILIFAQKVEKKECLFQLLTNCKVGYWELYKGNYWNRYVKGYSFSSDSLWVEYLIDANGCRVIDMISYHNLFSEEKKFEISGNDTLILSYRSSLDGLWITYKTFQLQTINKERIKLTCSEVRTINGYDSIVVVANEYDFSRDLATIPDYGRNIYPNNKEKWDMGDMSDSPVILINNN